MGPVRPPRPHHLRYPADDLTAAVLGPVELAVFENLYSAHAGEARRLAAGFVGDTTNALDVVHTAYVEILRRLLRGWRWTDPADARAAVLRNTRWAALNSLRAARRKAETPPLTVEEPQPAVEEWARSEARMLCEQIVEQLSTTDRRVIQIRYVEGRTNAECGQQLGVTEKAFEHRLSRAIKRARRIAQSSNLLPALVPSGLAGSAGVRRRTADWRVVRQAAVKVAAVAAAVVCTADLLGHQIEGMTSRNVAAIRADPTDASMPAQPDQLAVQGTAVTDAVAVGSGPSTQVFALGRDAACSCERLWRSLDAGVTWRSAPVPAGLPDGVHIVVGSWRGGPSLIALVEPQGRSLTAAGFGSPFLPTPAVPPATRGARRALSCGRALQVPFCFGRAPGQGSGLVLVVDRTRLLYFNPLGGIELSTEGGTSWTESGV